MMESCSSDDDSNSKGIESITSGEIIVLEEESQKWRICVVSSVEECGENVTIITKGFITFY